MSDPFDFDTRPPLYAVMGNPVAHSRSPRIHGLFGEQCGIRLDYRAIQVDPGGFPQAVSNFQGSGGRGLNVTVPFKVEAWKLAERVSERAAEAAAVNTLRFEHGGQRFGDNTDGIGLVRDLTVNLGCALEGRRLLVVGAGGAVRGVLGPVLDLAPAAVVIANRTVDRAGELAARFAGRGEVAGCGFEELGGERFDVVINATSASLEGSVPALPAGVAAGCGLAYDMVYAARPTPFMRWAAEHGAAATADGLGMLVEQAAESFEIWHGVHPDTAPVIAALRAEL